MLPDRLPCNDIAKHAGRRRRAGSVRTVLLTDDFDRRAPALLAALRTDWAEIELHVLCPDPVRAAHPRGAAPSLPEPSLPKRWAIALSRLLARLPFHCAVQLVAYSPDLVIAEDFGARTLQAALYRSLSRRSRLLLCAIEPPPRFGLIERLVLSQVDGILAEGESMVRAVEQLDIPTSRVFPISTPGDFETFLACPRVRPGPAAHRLACVGDLSPHSGAVDLLIGLAAWAERHPDRQAEIWWLGEGDLAGVLEAQPLPDNMTQRFLGTLNPQPTLRRSSPSAASSPCRASATTAPPRSRRRSPPA